MSRTFDAVLALCAADATVTVLGRTLDSCCIEEHSDGRRGGRFRTHPQHFLAKHRLSMVKTMSGVTIRGKMTALCV